MTDAFTDYESKDDLVTRDYKSGEKEALLSYMRSFRYDAVAAGFFDDVVTGEMKIGIDYLAFDDGIFSWTSRDTYHVEHYDLAPRDEFLAAALAA
ncbi:hypothetical protein [Adlercreutzia caecimuris]|uniref:hypothetical protein n=1 Tax=Adlercreutzia caecimuris TaxID=671266 RepID=UPI000EDC8085|nr:hypothetical protein [Adlercreutzia caecimuris]NBJ66139.1 hypothetical protein [Adlercreutzia caecimuris]